MTKDTPRIHEDTDPVEGRVDPALIPDFGVEDGTEEVDCENRIHNERKGGHSGQGPPSGIDYLDLANIPDSWDDEEAKEGDTTREGGGNGGNESHPNRDYPF